MILFSGIFFYSTASTPDAAYIIGGYYTGDIVAEFKNNSWRRTGTLASGRCTHASITFGDEFMVIGGVSKTGRLIYFFLLAFLITKFQEEMAFQTTISFFGSK